MKKNIALLLSISLFIISVQSIAQSQVVFQEKQKKSILFSYNAQNSNKDINHIIRKLSESTGKSIHKTEYIFNYEQNLRLTRSNNSLFVTINFNDLNCTGDVIYKGFPLHDLLIPYKLTFKADLLNNLNQSIKVFNFNDIKIIDGIAETASTDISDSTQTNYKLSISNLVFEYSPKRMNEFNDRLRFINDYYASDALIEATFQNLNSVIPTDIDNLQMHDITLKQIEYSIIQIEQKNFAEKLSLNHFDPVQLLKKINVLKHQTLLIRGALNQQIATLDATFYNKGLEYLVNNKPQQAITYFEKSLQVNPNFAPSSFQLAKIDFQNQNVASSESRLKSIILNQNLDPETKSNTLQLLHEILALYLNEGLRLNNSGSFDNALHEFEKARKICTGIPGIFCEETLYKGIADAKNGKYKIMLSGAETELSNGRLDGAEESIKKAMKYQSLNSFEIPSDEDAKSILIKIKNKLYLNLIESAKKNLSKKVFKTALEEINNAAYLESSYSLKAHPELISIRKKAGKPILIETIEFALNEVKANNLSKARSVAKEVEDAARLYQLMDDNEIEKKLSELKSKINTQECINAQLKINDLYDSGLKAKTSSSFVEAQSILEQALKIASENSDCQINVEKIRDENFTIIPASTYQKLCNQTIDLIRTERISEAFEKRKECDRYYYQFNIASFNLIHPDLLTFALSQNSNSFMVYTADYFLNFNEPDKVLILHKTLLQKGYPVNYIKKPLASVGIQLAIRDKNQNPSGNPKSLAFKYTSGDKKLKALYRAYVKQWKRK